MPKFKPCRKSQFILFPNSIDDYVPENHLSRMISNIVEQLNTKDIEDKYSQLGQNTYHPKILIKLLFYGYAIGESSGRKISSKCETDTAYIYLAQMYKPDFRTSMISGKIILRNYLNTLSILSAVVKLWA